MDELSGNLDVFKEHVSQFTDIDKQIKAEEAKIKPIRENISFLKKEKGILKGDICIYMNENDIEKCNLPDNNGSISFKRRKSVVPINKDVIKEDLKRYFCVGPGKESRFYNMTDIEKAKSIYSYIYEDREYRFIDVLTKRN